MQITTVMVVLFLLWCPLTLAAARGRRKSLQRPSAETLHFSDSGLGWFKAPSGPTIPMAAIIIALRPTRCCP